MATALNILIFDGNYQEHKNLKPPVTLLATIDPCQHKLMCVHVFAVLLLLNTKTYKTYYNLSDCNYGYRIFDCTYDYHIFFITDVLFPRSSYWQ